MSKLQECRDRGFHDWEIVSVMGMLPDQEIQLVCNNCDAEVFSVDITNYIDEPDDDDDF